MAVGKSSPIVKALQFVSKRSTGDVRVHVVKNPFEKDTMGSALEVFDEYSMTRTTDRNAVLIYINLSTKAFSIIADEGIHRAVGQRYWDELAANMREDLQSTQFENSVALTVYTLAVTLEKYFPIDEGRAVQPRR